MAIETPHRTRLSPQSGAAATAMIAEERPPSAAITIAARALDAPKLAAASDHTLIMPQGGGRAEARAIPGEKG